MPGIHVRSIGRLHWEDHDKEPTLTVPGSYWLCHKNNIYKFTFKFHKTIRNAIDFSHSKELMKIIRRVIKWQPRQGQHFSTKNLLVTYNHASWTRQDKMFAVMKFCDRPDAIAFPHAFILTVKVLNQDQQLAENTMGTKETKPQSPVSEDNGAVPPESSPSGSVLRGKEKMFEVVSTISQEEKENNSETSWSLRTRSRHKDAENSLSTSVTDRDEGECQNSVNGNGAVELNSADDVLDSGKDMESDAEEVPKQRSIEATSVPPGDDENSNSSNGSHSDSASLPYQYLIERDIERELENSRLAGTVSSKENDSGNANVAVKKCSSSGEQVDEGESQGSRDSRKSVGKQKIRNDLKENDSTPPDVTSLRSSDITDLVMKGLMFTIRQDKDTVTVVEQKTKLELDEVLENSEKVETKEGDPCLLNSSLLRLEKMITRMQEPPPTPTEQKRNGLAENAFASFVDLADEINIETEMMKVTELTDQKTVCPSTGPVEMASSWSQFFTDKAVSDATFQNIEKVLGDSSVYLSDQDDDLELKIDDEEEEDIIPEALVNNSLFDGSLDAMRKTPMLDAFEDLLMDDIEPDSEKIIIVDEEEETKKVNFSRPNNDSKINGITYVKDSSRLPKVISNQIITNDQIPPALLRALKSKSAFNQISRKNEVSTSSSINNLSENNNKINIKSIESEIDMNINSNGSVGENIKNNVDKNNTETIKRNSAVVMLERHKENNFLQSSENSTVFNSVSSSKVTRKSLLVNENNNAEKSQTSNEVKNSDINYSLSNSNSANIGRLTRSNSKLHIKSNETSASISDESISRQSRVETRSQKFLQKRSNQLLTNKNLIKKISISQKRKRSEINHDQIVSKFHKSASVNGANGEVTIKMCKLINDLKHGVKVVVERMDVTKISR